MRVMSGREVFRMLLNPLSKYPDSVDPMIFFQDINLTQVEAMDTYGRLISQGSYKQANDYIAGQDGIHGWFADYFNAIENRIYKLQEYLLSQEPDYLFLSSDTEPDADIRAIWL